MLDRALHGMIHDWKASGRRTIYCIHRGTNPTHYHAKPEDIDNDAASKGMATMLALCAPCAEAAGYAKGSPDA